jgi:hypothetical protein
MKFAAISANEKVWEVLYASIFLEGEEQAEALRRLQVPAHPLPDAG